MGHQKTTKKKKLIETEQDHKLDIHLYKSFRRSQQFHVMTKPPQNMLLI